MVNLPRPHSARDRYDSSRKYWEVADPSNEEKTMKIVTRPEGSGALSFTVF